MTNRILISEMSSEEIEDQQQKIKQTRNTREEGRDYGCPCGKAYLSYPALYTHIRTKHNGVAPGVITKPKHQRVKGKAKSMAVTQHIVKEIEPEDSDRSFNLLEEAGKILTNITVDYDEKFQSSDGQNTCQDMASNFLQELRRLKLSQLKVVQCFLNEIKLLIDTKFGQSYWTTKDPSQLVVIANSLYQQHETKKKQFPLENPTLFELIFLLFKWMYKNKWTNDRLIKRNQHFGLLTMIK